MNSLKRLTHRKCELRAPPPPFNVATIQRFNAPTSHSAFTMVEIALCIAIIGFALVAIIGVLPTAMRVQQDNRADTLIDQDGNYFLEAIRTGARGLDDLTNYVETFASASNYPVRSVSSNGPVLFGPKQYNTGEKLIGLLSLPRTNDDGFRMEVEFRAISGAAVEKDPTSPISFEYLLVSEVFPFAAYDRFTSFGAADPITVTNMASNLTNNLYEVRLTFKWPIIPRTGQVGNNRKVFRTLVSGFLAPVKIDGDDYRFFQPATFVPNNPP